MTKWIVGALAFTLACGPSSSRDGDAGARSSEAPASASAPDAPKLDGGELATRFQCARCHDGLGAEHEVARDKHCVRCHLDIGDGKFEAPKEALADWKPRVMHLRFAPSLSGIGRLVKPEWASKFLLRPFDVRPALHPRMPRLKVDEAEAKALAQWVASLGEQLPAVSAIEPNSGNIERGRGLFEDKSCTNCHTFTGAGTRAPRSLPFDKTARDRALAPDLRFARDRLVREHVVAYLRDPQSVKPDAAMPKPDISAAEATDLAAFVLNAPLDAAASPPVVVRLPVLERSVTYDEVASKVLHKICWHCHSQPDYARGDGGPGNTGGFGFSPRKLDLSSYESIASGYIDDSGERTSLFSGASGPPAEGSIRGESILIESLVARQREDRGDIGDVRGMPLGLPPLSPEDIQLVDTWIAQGHPR